MVLHRGCCEGHRMTRVCVRSSSSLPEPTHATHPPLLTPNRSVKNLPPIAVLRFACPNALCAPSRSSSSKDSPGVSSPGKLSPLSCINAKDTSWGHSGGICGKRMRRVQGKENGLGIGLRQSFRVENAIIPDSANMTAFCREKKKAKLAC